MPEIDLSLLDWRRRVNDLYAAVRRHSDPASAHRLWIDTRNELFATHPQSPLPIEQRSNFSGLKIAPYDPQYRFEVDLDTLLEPKQIRLPGARDAELAGDRDAELAGERLGRIHLGSLGSLDVWWLDTYGGGVFVPVKDSLAGTLTYGGGRYVLDTAKGADLGGDGDRLVVDLNFAYNPSCAHNPAWVCPLAPAGNVLEVAARAGELMMPPG